MSDMAIKVENLSKRYLIGHQRQERYVALRDVMAEGAKDLARKLLHPFNSSTGQRFNDSTEEFYALKNVSFEIKRGDRVGIIGRNGAGKSTLLKILSRISEPTSGRIEIEGRVASLLEVGTGFHPELTGRENIYLNGAILGMARAEIKRKFDEIVDFAEIEKFLDTPVKRYSSGMYVRLAFAVAAHLEPEILVVDEVLAVGDAQFQQKCLGKMEEVGRGGRTVLFVSHNMAAIKAMCSRCIMLEQGRTVFGGDVDVAVSHYQNSGGISQNHIVWENLESAPGNDRVKLLEVSVGPASGDVLSIDSGFDVMAKLYSYDDSVSLDVTIYLFTFDNLCVFESGVVVANKRDSRRGRYEVKTTVQGHILNSGNYYINIVIGESQKYVVYRKNEVISFEIENTSTGRGDNMSKASGVVRPLLNWSCRYLD